MPRRRWSHRLLAVLVLLVGPWAAALAEDAGAPLPDPSCQDGGVISGKLLTDICWDCIFPIRMGGVASFGSERAAGAVIPDGASEQTFCACDDGAGLPHPGYTVAMWMPAMLFELVRSPGCAMTLGGIKLPITDPRLLGDRGRGWQDFSDEAFYSYHQYAFPLLTIMDLFLDPRCNAGGYSDLDLMYFSELDPTWAASELAFFTNPEVSAVANPTAWAACPIDAARALVDQPIEELFWCVGSQGWLYPLSGYTNAWGSLAGQTSHVLYKAIAAQHRRGMMRRTVGSDALCTPPVEPMFPKQQYGMSMFFPLPEAEGKHPVGRSALLWGSWRQIPATGEDAIYLLWRWRDCCVEFL